MDTLEEGWQTYYDSLADYQDGLSEYEDGVAEFDQEIADAEDQLADARADLADLEDPELYVLSRSESNSGYVTFESDSTIVQRLSTIFPIFFFLIAALVCSTTMTRMVDDHAPRSAPCGPLGYSRGAILSKYLLYSGSAATIGCLIGYFGGGLLFPAVIWIAYKMLYNIPGFICTYDPVLFVLSLAASLLCSAGVTYLSPWHEMHSTAGRPDPPQGSRRGQAHPAGALYPLLAAPEIPAQGIAAQYLPVQKADVHDAAGHRRMHRPGAHRFRHPGFGGQYRQLPV